MTALSVLAQAAEARLKAMPEEKLGPAGKILVSHPRHTKPPLCEHGQLRPHSLGVYEREVLKADGQIGLGSEEVVCPGGLVERLTVREGDE